jgi:hypothetical protein
MRGGVVFDHTGPFLYQYFIRNFADALFYLRISS